MQGPISSAKYYDKTPQSKKIKGKAYHSFE
jgi:hypothetical protein